LGLSQYLAFVPFELSLWGAPGTVTEQARLSGSRLDFYLSAGTKQNLLSACVPFASDPHNLTEIPWEAFDVDVAPK
jgi:hypothetical protein